MQRHKGRENEKGPVRGGFPEPEVDSNRVTLRMIRKQLMHGRQMVLGEEKIPALLEGMGDKDVAVRKGAASSLSYLACEMGEIREAAPVMVKALDDTDGNVVSSAALAIGRMAVKHPEYGWEGAIAPLARIVGSETDRSANAFFALSKIGAPAVPALEAAMESWDQVARRMGVNALVAMANEASARALIRVLNSGYVEDVKEHVADAIRILAEKKQGWDLSGAVAPLAEIMRVDGIISRIAARALRAIGIEKLDMLEDRLLCLFMAGDYDAVARLRDPGLVEALRNMASDGSRGWMREGVFEAMEKLGKPAVPALISVLRFGDDREKDLAEKALNWMGPHAVEGLAGLLGDENADARGRAVALLGKNGLVGNELLVVLRKLENGNALERLGAAVAIGEAASNRRTGWYSKIFPALVDAMGDAEAEVRAAAIEALLKAAKKKTEYNTDNFMPAVLARLEDGDAKVREAAMRAALGIYSMHQKKYGMDDILPHMVRCMRHPEIADLAEGKVCEFLPSYPSEVAGCITEFVNGNGGDVLLKTDTPTGIFFDRLHNLMLQCGERMQDAT